jgi:hypothetical protein
VELMTLQPLVRAATMLVTPEWRFIPERKISANGAARYSGSCLIMFA